MLLSGCDQIALVPSTNVDCACRGSWLASWHVSGICWHTGPVPDASSCWRGGEAFLPLLQHCSCQRGSHRGRGCLQVEEIDHQHRGPTTSKLGTREGRAGDGLFRFRVDMWRRSFASWDRRCPVGHMNSAPRKMHLAVWLRTLRCGPAARTAATEPSSTGDSSGRSSESFQTSSQQAQLQSPGQGVPGAFRPDSSAGSGDCHVRALRPSFCEVFDRFQVSEELPFAECPAVVRMTGKSLRYALEEMLASAPTPVGCFPHVSTGTLALQGPRRGRCGCCVNVPLGF